MFRPGDCGAQDLGTGSGTPGIYQVPPGAEAVARSLFEKYGDFSWDFTWDFNGIVNENLPSGNLT